MEVKEAIKAIKQMKFHGESAFLVKVLITYISALEQQLADAQERATNLESEVDNCPNKKHHLQPTNTVIYELKRLKQQLADEQARAASLCDFLNCWAREAGVDEASDPSENKQVVDRLWGRLSSELGELHYAKQQLATKTRECEALQKRAKSHNEHCNGSTYRFTIDLARKHKEAEFWKEQCRGAFCDGSSMAYVNKKIANLEAQLKENKP